ncbi:unnamed protein product [Knipowitschia caucasica]
MMLYGRELDTPLDLITQPSSDGVDEPGVPYPETLRASLQEAHGHARAALDHSHDRQKHYYDLRRRHATFNVGDLVRVKTHPRSDAQSSFTAKLAPLFEGPLQISQKLSDVNYRLTRMDSGANAGVYHVVNMQPFHTWDSLSTKGHPVSPPAVCGGDEVLDIDIAPHMTHTQQADNETALSALPFVLQDIDSVPMDCPSPESLSDPGPGHYNLRPRRDPRITSGWCDKKWTNAFHTDKMDLK